MGFCGVRWIQREGCGGLFGVSVGAGTQGRRASWFWFPVSWQGVLGKPGKAGKAEVSPLISPKRRGSKGRGGGRGREGNAKAREAKGGRGMGGNGARLQGKEREGKGRGPVAGDGKGWWGRGCNGNQGPSLEIVRTRMILVRTRTVDRSVKLQC